MYLDLHVRQINPGVGWTSFNVGSRNSEGEKVILVFAKAIINFTIARTHLLGIWIKLNMVNYNAFSFICNYKCLKTLNSVYFYYKYIISIISSLLFF